MRSSQRRPSTSRRMVPSGSTGETRYGKTPWRSGMGKTLKRYASSRQSRRRRPGRRRLQLEHDEIEQQTDAEHGEDIGEYGRAFEETLRINQRRAHPATTTDHLGREGRDPRKPTRD